MWKCDYPNDIYWYKLTTIAFKRNEDNFKAIFLNNRLLIESDCFETSFFEIDISEFINFLIEAVKNCINKMHNNIYNDFVNNNLSFENRYGIIARKD